MVSGKVAFSAEDLVYGAYRALLKREPDNTGFINNIDNIEGNYNKKVDPEEILRTVLSNFRSSEEFKDKYTLDGESKDKIIISRSDIEREIIKRIKVLLGKSANINHINSLGFQCYTSSLLKNFGLRKWSGPFDWIFSNPDMIDFCIRDNFNTFLDSDHYEYVPIEDRVDTRYNRVKHRYFQEKFSISPPIFNHVDAHTLEGQNYLRRCVDRFKTELKHGERKLFLQVVAESASTTKNFFSNFETLNTFSNNPIFLRIVIREDCTSSPYPNFEFSERMHGHYACCYVNPTSKWLATQFEDMGEDLLLARFVCNYFSREIS